MAKKRKKGTGTGPSMAYDESKWRAQSDHDTLTRAAEVHADPSRMAAVRNHHVEQTKKLKSMDKALGGNKIRGSKDYKGLMGKLKGC